MSITTTSLPETAARGNRYATARISPGIAAKIRAAQYAALEQAIAGSPADLASFIRAEQRKRDASAAKEWQGYRLVRPEGARFWTHIQTPSGDRYECVTTGESVKRWIGCPDQDFVDAVNDAARMLGVVLRLETKHSEIAHLRERHASEGRLSWVEKGAAS